MNRREAIKRIAGAGALGAIAPVRLPGQTNTPTPASLAPLVKDNLHFWLETSLRRVYPTSPPGSGVPLQLETARQARLSFQACVCNRKTNSAIVRCEILGADDWQPLVRRVGFVPLRNFNTFVPQDELEGIGFIPGLCPDPLFPDNQAHIGPQSNGVFWISLRVPADTKPGLRRLQVRLTLENEYSYVDFVRPKPWSIELTAEVTVYPLVIQPRKDFPVTKWISADSIWEYYKIEPYSERFWQLADAYIQNLTAHGCDVIYTPIFNARHELLVRPAQLLRVKRNEAGQYEFDFTDARRWVRLALKHGANHLEWTHFFTPAPTSGKYPQRIYERQEKLGPMLWPPEISATSETYRRFLQQFLPQFKEFLLAEGILERSLFHCADEPDGDLQMADYRKARGLLKEFAPWMKVMDAMSDVRFATDRLSDMPVPSIVTAPEFTKANCPAWAYFCCGPRERYVQRLLDTPLPKIRMLGWLLFKLGARGFLHWGYNYWFTFCTSRMSDPFLDAAVGAWPGLPAGDPFAVYPGENGPVDSVRWEVFAESLQDYALLQSAGIKPSDPLLEAIKDYREFPKSETWLRQAHRRILT